MGKGGGLSVGLIIRGLSPMSNQPFICCWKNQYSICNSWGRNILVYSVLISIQCIANCRNEASYLYRESTDQDTAQ